MFYAFVEFDGTFGRRKAARGFASEVLRDEWIAEQGPGPDEGWSDLETWEAHESEWPHIPIIVR
jgi:hypothetical protein